MGIKVFCPNGHKLNVKTFLAGKTGICPHCAVRFSIPKESGEARAQTEVAQARKKRRRKRRRKSSSAPPGSPMLVTTPVADGVGVVVNPVAAAFVPAGLPQTAAGVAMSPAGSLVDPIAEAPGARWYVQSTTGGRYGPAPGDMMRTWIAEGRVAADSLVWREGWNQWQTASIVFASLAQAQGAGGSSPHLPIDWSAEMPAPKESAIAVSGKLKVTRRSNRLVATVITLLVVVVLLLAIAFVIIMTREEPSANVRPGSTKLLATASPAVLVDRRTA